MKPFIIAELGSNWKTFDHAKEAIGLAKACGANAIKYQLYDSMALYGIPRRTADGLESPLPGQMAKDWIPKLADKAQAVGIEFMCSAFSPELMEFVNPYVNIHKIASAELTHVGMLETANKFGKPVYLSTGASGIKDIEMALNTLMVPVTLLYCVSAYPATVVDLGVMQSMQRMFGKPVGFSDHTLDVVHIPALAVGYGAQVIEKHFNPFNLTDTPDATHSLDVARFKMMVDSISGKLQTDIGPGLEENEMVTKHNRRLIAIKNISPGEQLVYGANFGIYRSLKHETKALSPFLREIVNGKIAKNPIACGDGIGQNDF